MTFYILLNQVAMLFVSMNVLTTLTFDSEIKAFYYGGGKEEVFIKETDGKTLLIKPYRVDSLSNLLVVTQKRKFYFQLTHDGKEVHKFIEVKHGVINHALKKKLETKDFEILEGGTSILFINKRPSEINVNGRRIKSREYLSKGVPIFVENNRILN